MIRHNKVLSTRIRASWNRIWKLVTGCNCLQEFENPLDPKTLESGFGDQILWFRKDGRPILKKNVYICGLQKYPDLCGRRSFPRHSMAHSSLIIFIGIRLPSRWNKRTRSPKNASFWICSPLLLLLLFLRSDGFGVVLQVPSITKDTKEPNSRVLLWASLFGCIVSLFESNLRLGT